jgi:predicted outer membrane protein
MKRTLFRSALAPLVGLSLAASTAADEEGKLILGLHQGHLNEIEMGGLGQRNGGFGVKAYGEMLVRDHKKADVQLLDFAGRHGLPLATPGEPVGPRTRYAEAGVNAQQALDMPGVQTPKTKPLQGSPDVLAPEERPWQIAFREEYARLKDARGPEFDQKFLARTVEELEQDIAQMSQARATLNDASELALLLDQQLRVLQKHLGTARALQSNAPPPR